MQKNNHHTELSGMHRFDNGLIVEEGCLIPKQRERYAVNNLHEPVEEEWICRFCQENPASPFTFWDIGAGIGYYTMLVAKQRADANVHAFEPLPAHAAAIRRHWDHNKLDPDRLNLHEVAVGATAGKASLVDRNFGSHLARRAAPTGAIEVSVVTIDMMLQAWLGPVDLIKVDVQGFENDVLSGGSNFTERVRTWVIGTHNAPVHQSVHDRLSACGYEIVLSEIDVPGQPDGLVIATRPRD